jgi:hypothetical protein
MVWVELELGQKVKMMTLQSNSDHSIGTLVTSVTRVYQIEVDLDVDSSSFDFNLFQTDIVHSKKDESRKTRAGVNKTTTEPSKAVKEKGSY